jgi:peptidoglycan L-alanyl-D-glutamate endopeptidase CwlK
LTTTEWRSEFLRKIGLFFTRVYLLDEFDTESDGLKYHIICSTFHRSAEEQNEIYQSGRTKPGPVLTQCDGYTNVSKHQLWRAMDLYLADANTDLLLWDDEPYEELGEIWESFGGTWGGRFTNKDSGHFEI